MGAIVKTSARRSRASLHCCHTAAEKNLCVADIRDAMSRISLTLVFAAGYGSGSVEIRDGAARARKCISPSVYRAISLHLRLDKSRVCVPL
jgi:hypothetical protein